MDILDDILTELIGGVSHEYLVSMGVVIILTATLVFIDTTQRVAIEVLRYNKDNHRPNTNNHNIMDTSVRKETKKSNR